MTKIVEAVADAIIAGLLRKDEDGGPAVWHSNYDQTPPREAFNIDGEVHPLEIAALVLDAIPADPDQVERVMKAVGEMIAFPAPLRMGVRYDDTTDTEIRETLNEFIQDTFIEHLWPGLLRHAAETAVKALTETSTPPPVMEPHVATFLRAVRASPGAKHPVVSYYAGEAGDGPPSWQVAEQNCWVSCLGSHKWELTPAGMRAIGAVDAGMPIVPNDLAAVLQPFAKLADDFAAVCTHQVGGRGIYGLIPETPLPVGGELAQKTCTISIGDLIAIRDAYNTLQKGTTNA